MITAYIGIGANLGNARQTVREAIGQLAHIAGCKLTSASTLYSSAPIDSSGDDYVNAVAELLTSLSAQSLLEALQAIELTFGRERPYRNAPRTLDLDVLLYGTEKIATETLTVPHPRMTERAFVLLPLVQIAPDISIPEQGKAADLLEGVRDQVIFQLADSEVTP
ncbi:2-amino-4-hydroxy-6-hydroxymethyldihydropteridine diphosphokinase [Undibacterium sp. SXout11W]|uniref:2-amino-4-hydroxy-6- hydroxymethyldihydropteridine diphosphokinase n=1 Tax=Undibacterium sp. SXout11W TaxID=3413050 RepID=UPI003BF3C675